MEQGYGGPVWHASIAYHGPARGLNGIAGARLDRAMRHLRGVGDPTLGEWVEHTPRATHLRRRLSAAEVAASGCVMRDVRGTPEADLLLAPYRHRLPAGYHE